MTVMARIYKWGEEDRKSADLLGEKKLKKLGKHRN